MMDGGVGRAPQPHLAPNSPNPAWLQSWQCFGWRLRPMARGGGSSWNQRWDLPSLLSPRTPLPVPLLPLGVGSLILPFWNLWSSGFLLLGLKGVMMDGSEGRAPQPHLALSPTPPTRLGFRVGLGLDGDCGAGAPPGIRGGTSLLAVPKSAPAGATSPPGLGLPDYVLPFWNLLWSLGAMMDWGAGEGAPTSPCPLAARLALPLSLLCLPRRHPSVRRARRRGTPPRGSIRPSVRPPGMAGPMAL